VIYPQRSFRRNTIIETETKGLIFGVLIIEMSAGLMENEKSFLVNGNHVSILSEIGIKSIKGRTGLRKLKEGCPETAMRASPLVSS
jgi:hypothetical protein